MMRAFRTGGRRVILGTASWRLARLARGMTEHVTATILRLGGKRYFDAAHFDRTYAAPDPWAYGTSPYEAVRRAALLAALPRARYRSVLEVGCGEGHMTRLLADRADRVVGVDISDIALGRARRAGLPPNVSVVRGDLLDAQLPSEVQAGAFDLVICAEVLYYCYRLPLGAASRRTLERLVAWLAPGGDLVLMHPLHFPTHYPFDRLAAASFPRLGGGEPPPLIRLGRWRLALPSRPVTVAVYRRASDDPGSG